MRFHHLSPLLTYAALASMAAHKDQGGGSPTTVPEKAATGGAAIPVTVVDEGGFDFAGAQARFEAAEKVAADLAAAREDITGLRADLAAVRAERDALAARLAGEPAAAKPIVPANLTRNTDTEHADRDQLGAAIFHQLQINGREMSVAELATLLKKRFADVVEAGKAYDYLTLSAADETGLISMIEP